MTRVRTIVVCAVRCGLGIFVYVQMRRKKRPSPKAKPRPDGQGAAAPRRDFAAVPTETVAGLELALEVGTPHRVRDAHRGGGFPWMAHIH
jgi:hypothetical protein